MKISVLRALFVVLVSFFFAPLVVRANEEFSIMHHIQDAHEWHLWGEGHSAASISLPILLVDGGLKCFSSSNFYHGKECVDTLEDGTVQSYLLGVGPAAGYAMLHEKIYRTHHDKLHFHNGHPINPTPWDFSITKNVLSLFIGAVLLVLLMMVTANFYKRKGAVAPQGIAKFIEPLIVFVRDEVAIPNLPHGKHVKYLGFLTTVFFFILINNLLGMIPIFPGGANLTGNITVTFFLACCTLLITLFSGNKNYWKHIFATPGVPKALLPIMIPIEIVGIFTKPFALMIRLFANMTAGHIIILALFSIIFLNKSAAWAGLSVPMALFISLLEVLVAFLQAYLFSMLSALFIGAAVEEEHH